MKPKSLSSFPNLSHRKSSFLLRPDSGPNQNNLFSLRQIRFGFVSKTISERLTFLFLTLLINVEIVKPAVLGYVLVNNSSQTLALSYRPARLHRLTGQNDNPMPESTISPSQGLWIWLQYCTVQYCDAHIHTKCPVITLMYLPLHLAWLTRINDPASRLYTYRLQPTILYVHKSQAPTKRRTSTERPKPKL